MPTAAVGKTRRTRRLSRTTTPRLPGQRRRRPDPLRPTGRQHFPHGHRGENAGKGAEANHGLECEQGVGHCGIDPTGDLTSWTLVVFNQ